MSTLGTNYGVSELRIALALEDAINNYLVNGTMPNEGTLYGISEKRLAIAIAENTGISGGGSAVWGAITGNLASQSDLSTALGLKQNSLVSGANIKTINSNSLLGSGDLSVQSTLVSGTNIKTINSTSLLGSGDLTSGNLGLQSTLISGNNIKTIENQSILGSGNIDLTKSDVGLSNVDNTSDLSKPIATLTQVALNNKQDTLISGLNLKTINGGSLLGSGDLTVQNTLISGANIKTINNNNLLGSGNLNVATSPSGSNGQIQFNDAGNFGANSNFVWDNANNVFKISGTIFIPSSINYFITDLNSPFSSIGATTSAVAGTTGNGGYSLVGISNNGSKPSLSLSGFIGGQAADAFVCQFSSLKLSSSGGFPSPLSLNDKAFSFSNGSLNIFELYGGGQSIHYSVNTSAVPLTVQGSAGQSANLFNVTNSGGSILSVLAKADGSYGPTTLTDVSAANNSAYFSSTTSRLTYKNSAGVLNSFSGINTGDQSSIVGISGTTSQFNTALTDGDFATLAGAGTLTNKVIVRKLSTKTANYTLTDADSFVRFNGTNLTATLPDATTLSGYEFEIKNVNSTSLIINATSSQLIDANLTVTLTQYEALKIVSNGTSWDVI